MSVDGELTPGVETVSLEQPTISKHVVTEYVANAIRVFTAGVSEDAGNSSRRFLRCLQRPAITFDNPIMVSSKPGWYKDPQNPKNARYWDGYKWSNHVRELQPKAPADSGSDSSGASLKPVPTPPISFPFQPQGMVSGESTKDATDVTKAFRPQSYDEKNAGPGLFVEEEKPADYSRARRGGKNKTQLKKIASTTLMSVGVGLLVGLVIGAATVPVFDGARKVQILVVTDQPTPEQNSSQSP